MCNYWFPEIFFIKKPIFTEILMAGSIEIAFVFFVFGQ